MKKINIVKKNLEFNEIIKKGRKYYSDLFFVYILKNSYPYNRYGISVSKKVGNAVTRNKYKRRIKNIIDNLKNPLFGYDIIIISRPKLKFSEYSDIENNIIKLMNEMVK
jgi:ribonuclease P protein component